MSQEVKDVEEQYVRGSVVLMKELSEADIEVMKNMPVGTFLVLHEELGEMYEEEKKQMELGTKSGGRSVPRTLRS